MTKSQVSPTSELQSTIDRYSHALDSVEKKSPQPSESEILEVLLARDEVKSTLEGITDAETQQVETLIKLDDRLNKQARVIARCGNLPDWRKSVKPDDSAWWWFFQTRKKVNQWDRMDWLWNLLSAGCLAITASLFITIFRSLSVGGGITWQQSFAGIAQGTGLIVLAQSSLTSKGQERVQNLLRNMGIPDYLYSEATFSASLVLLLISGATYYQMPGWLKEKGQENYNMGNLSQAETRYLQALNLDPENSSINLRLGEVYESLGSLDQALEQYNVAAQDGTPEALNNIGHIYIHRFNPAKRRNTPIVAETFLRLGVQRITEDTPHVTQYMLHRNLGWSLVAQKQYEEAENHLKDSIEIYDQLDDEETQQIAIASECLLTQVYEAQDRPVSDLNPVYQDCIDRSLPQTTDQYKWLLSVGERRLAACMDTSKIVENPNPAPIETNPLCGEPMVMAPPQVSQPEEIENLRVGLSDTLNSSWTQVPTFSEPVSYVVTVNSEGTVVEYEPIGDAAGQYDEETPLPGLVEETDNETAIVNFQVTFNPNDSYEVSYLESENTDESREAE